MKTIKTILNYKRSISFLCFLVILLFISLPIKSQDLPCANEVFQDILFKDSAFQIAFNNVNNAIANNPNRVAAATILEIPIVIHILHLGEPIGTGTNKSDAQIIAAVRGANERWRKITNVGIDMEVQFCLAQFDENGNPSTGIIRKNASSFPNYAQYGIGYIGALGQPSADEIGLKNLSNWNHGHVYNIWVVNKIAGNWGGYAFFPLGFNYATDGVVITSNSISYTSTTLAHELGHGMGLFHTFQGSENGCPANDLCGIQGDWVCDTPPHKQTECAPNGNNCSRNTPDSLLSLSFANIMSYCSGLNLFTQGQKNRSRDIIMTTTRKQLLSSYACSGRPCDTAFTQINVSTCDSNLANTRLDTLLTSKGCDSIIKTTTTFISSPIASFSYTRNNDTVTFINQSQHASNYIWNFGDSTSNTEISPTHIYSNGGNYNVALVASNECYDDTLKQTLQIPISTGINNNNKILSLSIYPNPTNGILNIELKIDNNNSYIEIINLLGQAVFTQKLSTGKQHNISLDKTLPKGIYQIMIRNENAIIASRLFNLY